MARSWRFSPLAGLVFAALAGQANGASLIVSSNSVSLNANAGTRTAVTTTVDVTASSGSLTFTAAASVQSGGNWLSVVPSSGSTPNTLTISANPSGLAAATYNGAITLTCSSGSTC